MMKITWFSYCPAPYIHDEKNLVFILLLQAIYMMKKVGFHTVPKDYPWPEQPICVIEKLGFHNAPTAYIPDEKSCFSHCPDSLSLA
jgi:hypothetical protein